MDNQQPPDRIWLQIGAGMDGYGINATWHSEPIGEPDLEEVEYVRVGLATDSTETLKAILRDVLLGRDCQGYFTEDEYLSAKAAELLTLLTVPQKEADHG